MKTIVICGGHLTPALALIEGLKEDRKIRIIFFGRKRATEGSQNLSAEARSIAAKHIIFIPITAGRLQRTFTRFTIPSLLKVPIGFLQSFFYLAKFRPSLIVSFGGYLSPPVVIGGWFLGITSIAHEQSALPGLASKINSLFVSRLFLTWSSSQKYFDGDMCQVIGNLTRQSIFEKKAQDPQIQKFLKKRQKLILVTGGNQGSHFLNTIAFSILPKLGNFCLIHQVGTANFDGDLEKALKIKRANYLAIDYITEQNIGAVLDRADLVISRSGANTVWDLATLSKVAILVPLVSSASGEQSSNAKILAGAGSAIVIDQEKLTADRLMQEIERIFANYQKFQQNARKFAKHLPQKGLAQIINFIGQ